MKPRPAESEIRDFRKATTALRQDCGDLRNRFDDGFSEMRARFDGLAAGQQQIVDLLRTIVTEQRRGGTAE